MKKIFLLFSLGMVLLASVLVGRTLLTTESSVEPPERLSTVTVDGEAATGRLARALTYRTVSRPYPEPQNPATFGPFVEYLKSAYPTVFSRLEVETVGGYSLLIRWPGSQPGLKPILLMSHMDVVPVIPGTEKRWRHPPYDGVVSDGYIWGRGALDDKSGVLGILEAVEVLLHEDFFPSRDIYLAFGEDEEVGGQQGALQIASLLESRGVRLEFVLDEGGAITRGIVPGVSGPVALIGPAEKGYLSLELSAEDAGGHSSQPPPVTAAGRVARAVDRIQSNPFPLTMEHTATFIAHLGEEVSFVQRMVFANAWLFGPFIEQLLPDNPALIAGMRTTVAPTMLAGSVKDNVLPMEARAVVNFRIIPGESVASVTARVEALVDDERIGVEPYGFVSEPSPVASTDSFGYRMLERSIRQVVGDPALVIAPRLVIGATDARHFARIADASFRFLGVTLGPEELKGFHGTNERVSVEGYLEAIKIYYRLIRNAAS
ncbi:M20 family peptidase [Aestuariirhabdus litorea]|uniref:M20/M25/M40 family metallo-hydrolase n=1 Tax=Aestuariirhabdus litorea TaxID=2528527 RepID=A0A3P3VTM0_9GAMM|nr:M20 family peptidase [Aestuariirhabdus litorea]RRJ84809.1 M20/M25/M40 family metallo-hydrolase [Aestuariirhabdus litorea]RWW98034.1 M20/M25/M40 family metallo-hydrolase [Endozoicomonadaceae bacterium GTF-13]